MIIETIIAKTVLTNTVTISIVDSTISYFSTIFIYHDYTVIRYTSRFEFYSNIFTIGNARQELKQTSERSTIIIEVCIAIAVILIVMLLAVMLIRIRNKNLNSKDSEDELKDANHGEAITMCRAPTNMPSIAEDPFVNDFKEELDVSDLFI